MNRIRRLVPVFVRFRLLIEAGLQVGAVAFATVTAFLLRFDFSVPAVHLPHLRYAVAAWCVAKTLAFIGFRLHRSWWRYVSMDDVARLAAANVVGSVAGGLAIYWLAPAGFPRSIYVLDFVLCLGVTALIRVGARLISEVLHARPGNGGRKAAVVYGAGDAGVMLAREMRHNPGLGYALAGFVDDDGTKTGSRILGAPVLGRGTDLKRIVAERGVQAVLIALPSATGQEMTRVLNLCVEAGVSYKTMPPLGEVIENGGLLGQMRAVDVEDLLGRQAVRLDSLEISAKLKGKVVLVSGAAGSIGSELCRQIARFGPAKLVGYEMGETPLFYLEREMREKFPEVRFEAEIGSIQNERRLEEVFEAHKPEAVFHAAAYKHVPLMEAHAFEAVENNIFGTRALAETAARHGVGDFVMISTDKAVRPTNIMGATKRAAELVVRGLQGQFPGVKFVSVRFGNVLGSNGSVIPVFQEQIRKGGPVTVTHPEMQRYFMTIPEASQLVLQASTLGAGGEIFVLDMGAPVKIADLARNLILLSGLRPGEDIRIEYTGVRPGEKLFEEIHLHDEGVVETKHEKIRVFQGQVVRWEEMEGWLGRLRLICERRAMGQLVLALKEMVRDYNPSMEVLQSVFRERPREEAVGVG